MKYNVFIKCFRRFQSTVYFLSPNIFVTFQRDYFVQINFLINEYKHEVFSWIYLFLFNTFLIAIYFLNFIHKFILCFFLHYLIKLAVKLRYLTRKFFRKDTHSSGSCYLFRRILPIRLPKLTLSRSSPICSIPPCVLLPNIFCILGCRLNTINSYVISSF